MQDESVGEVKEMLAELVREKQLLVERLNDLQSHIALDQNLLSRVMRKAEWMEEKDRTVERLSKVQPSPPSLQPANLAKTPAADAGPSLTSNSPLLFGQVAASLWDLLEDDPRGGMPRGSSRSSHPPRSQALSRAHTQEGGDADDASPTRGSFKNVFSDDH
ncbi:hypothetical protein T484DRAFT_1856729, partial [Baffinella frigidus]